MHVLVTGGRGTLGRLLVPRLRAAGHEATITSRRAAPTDTDVRALDLANLDGLDAAVDGVDVIVHAASNPARAKRVDVHGTEALLEAARRADTAHFVYLSIVGIDDHPFPYYRAKLAAEKRIEASPVPSTILRATQFHEFLDRIFSTGPAITSFAGLEFQVIDGGLVADRLTDIVDGGPLGRAADLGGPRSELMHDMARSWKRTTRSRKPIALIPVIGKTARAFRERRHHTPNAATGSPTWDEWLADHAGPS